MPIIRVIPKKSRFLCGIVGIKADSSAVSVELSASSMSNWEASGMSMSKIESSTNFSVLVDIFDLLEVSQH